MSSMSVVGMQWCPWYFLFAQAASFPVKPHLYASVNQHEQHENCLKSSE